MLIADNAMSEHFGGGVVFMDTSEHASASSPATVRRSSGATARWRPPEDSAGWPAAASAPRWTRAASSRSSSTLGAGETARRRPSCSATPPTCDAARALAARFRDPSAARIAATTGAVAAWDDRLSRVQVRTPDRGARRHGQSAGCSTRRWPAACGDARPSTSRAAHSASAISCRTCWRCSGSTRRWRARNCSAPPRASSSRATCSTGGTNRAGMASGRDSPTIASG